MQILFPPVIQEGEEPHFLLPAVRESSAKSGAGSKNFQGMEVLESSLKLGTASLGCLEHASTKKAAKFPFPEHKSVAGSVKSPSGLGCAPEGEEFPLPAGISSQTPLDPQGGEEPPEFPAEFKESPPSC